MKHTTSKEQEEDLQSEDITSDDLPRNQENEESNKEDKTTMELANKRGNK